MAAPVHEGEQQIAHLFGHVRGVGRRGTGQRVIDLGELLNDLVARLRCALPVETNTRRTPADLRSPAEGGQRPWNVRQDAPVRRLRPLLRLQVLPAASLLLRARDAGAGENVRMPADELVVDRSCDGGEVEPAPLLGHARVEDDLEQQVPELVAQLLGPATLDGVCDLVGFLDRVRRYRGEGLLPVPGAPALRIAQAGHEGNEVRDGLPCVAHGVGSFRHSR